MGRIEGAFAAVVMTERGLAGFRDPDGIRPLVVGRLDDAWVLASESCALDLIGATLERELEPGEMVVVDERGARFRSVGDRAGIAVRIRVHLLRPARLGDARARPARGAPANGRAAGGGGCRRCGRGHRRARLGDARRRRLRPPQRHPVRRGPGQEPVRRAHVHPAGPGAAGTGRQAQVQRPPLRARGPPGGRRRRLHRARLDDAKARADAVRGGRARGAPARLVAADRLALLLRDRYGRPGRADRRRPHRRGGAPSGWARPRSPTCRWRASRPPPGRPRASAAPA